MPFYGGFGMGFEMIFFAMFALVALLIIVQLVRALMQWQSNNASPVLSVPARVTSKRMQVFHHNGENGADHSATHYYVTFEVESKDRLELALSGKEYGLLAEGDVGKLTFQGTRFLNFERQ